MFVFKKAPANKSTHSFTLSDDTIDVMIFMFKYGVHF